MSKKERLDNIMLLIKQNNYVTVKYLTEELQYSTATINRDLNLLENQGLILRKYGGAELKDATTVPLIFRYHKMRSEKRKIAKKAAEFVNDGDTLFVDGSTTCQYMAPHLLEKKNITIISNNITMISFLSENGIDCICLGGNIVESPSMLSGAIAVENAKKFKATKLFFSTRSFNDNGDILSPSDIYYLLQTAMIENSDQTFFLADKEKLEHPSRIILCDFSKVDYVISDYDFTCKEKFSNTQFINVK